MPARGSLAWSMGDRGKESRARWISQPGQVISQSRSIRSGEWLKHPSINPPTTSSSIPRLKSEGIGSGRGIGGTRSGWGRHELVGNGSSLRHVSQKHLSNSNACGGCATRKGIHLRVTITSLFSLPCVGEELSIASRPLLIYRRIDGKKLWILAN